VQENYLFQHSGKKRLLSWLSKVPLRCEFQEFWVKEKCNGKENRNKDNNNGLDQAIFVLRDR
jgi:hypothetical protein